MISIWKIKKSKKDDKTAPGRGKVCCAGVEIDKLRKERAFHNGGLIMKWVEGCIG